MPRYSRAIAPIVQWKPYHDQVIALHLAGYSIDAIAAALKRSRNGVANVINDPRAQKVIEVARKRTYGNIMEAVGDRMAVLGPKALDNIADTINIPVEDAEGKVAIGTKAKIHQDNVSFELLNRLGFGKGQEKTEAGVLKLSPETEKKLVEGVERARMAEIEFKKGEEVEFVDVTESGNGSGPRDNG